MVKEDHRTRKESRNNKTNMYWLAYQHVIHNGNNMVGNRAAQQEVRQSRLCQCKGKGSDSEE